MRLSEEEALMAEKTVADKLLIKPDSALWVSSDDDLARLGPLPGGVRRVSTPGEAATAVLFVGDESSLRSALEAAGSELAAAPVLWVAYPKGGRSDLNRDSLWPIVSELGLRPISQVAIDDTWSALRFRPLAPGEPQFMGR
jgi:hypothetical protein